MDYFPLECCKVSEGQIRELGTADRQFIITETNKDLATRFNQLYEELERLMRQALAQDPAFKWEIYSLGAYISGYK